jgi:pimeloyl-ACP methyl ester carboxylesterase
MAAFVLVHGSGQNARCWARVRHALTERGHRMAAPDLPKQAPDWGLEDYAAAIAESIVEPQTVVVGHSMSGVFLPLVPQVRECALLVFLAAVVPEPGTSVREQFAEDRSMFCRQWIEAGPRWFDESQKESLAREFLFHDCDEATIPWALGTLDRLDTRHLVTQPCPLSSWPSVPAASIVATQDRTLSPDWCRRISRRVLHQEAIEVPTGHCPHVSRPEEIAEALGRLATHAAG